MRKEVFQALVEQDFMGKVYSGELNSMTPLNQWHFMSATDWVSIFMMMASTDILLD